MSRLNIDFLGHRKIMFAISGVLIVVSIAALLLPQFGLTFGIEFQGGTVDQRRQLRRRDHRADAQRRSQTRACRTPTSRRRRRRA